METNNDPSQRLKEVITEHRQLDWKIRNLENLSPYKDDKIKVLKKEKLRLKDLIVSLEQEITNEKNIILKATKEESTDLVFSGD